MQTFFLFHLCNGNRHRQHLPPVRVALFAMIMGGGSLLVTGNSLLVTRDFPTPPSCKARHPRRPVAHENYKFRVFGSDVACLFQEIQQTRHRRIVVFQFRQIIVGTCGIQVTKVRIPCHSKLLLYMKSLVKRINAELYFVSRDPMRVCFWEKLEYFVFVKMFVFVKEKFLL